jgi:arylsulfatase A-like enzyme
MPRALRLLVSLVHLSARGAGFFYATALAHVLIKLGLGLTLMRDDGYRLGSLVSPPWVLVLASGDVLVCFAVAKAVDLTPAAYQRVLHGLCWLALYPFLLTSFIVHTYFKGFLNRGLLEFNGASSTELGDYTLAALNRVTLPVLLAVLVLMVAQLALDRLIQARPALARSKLLGGLLASAALGVAYLGTLSQGQCGFMGRNPGYELVRSYLDRSQGSAAPRASAAELASFGDAPRPLFGRYDTALDVRVPSQRGKNVLFVMIESLPLEQISLGGETDAFPVIAELAQDGVAFGNFRTAFPATSRSFLTYHCGIYPTTGAATATKARPSYGCESIVESARKAGYRTGFFTAPMFTYDNLHRSSVVRGYDTYQDFLSLEPRMKERDASAPAVDEETVVASLLDFVDGRGSAPFFATYFMFWNHAPYRLPHEDISTLPPHERYVRTLGYLDGVLRGLLGSLRERGALEDTLIVVAADHGEGFGIHHSNVNHVGHVYEDDVRIPFVVHVPGLGAHRTARQASNVDMAPTLASLLGFERAPSWQGQDMLAERFEPRPTLLFGRASYSTNAIVDGHLKYIEYPSDGRRFLYDLSADPHEQKPLDDSHRRELDAYGALVRRWLPVVEARAWAAQPRPANVELAHRAE